jgi:hypothetical protein
MFPDTNHKPTGRRAVTLIEAVLFISIALGLIVGGLVFFQQASLAQRTQQTVRLINALLAESWALHQVTGYDYGDAMVPLVAAGAVPSSALTGDPAKPVESPWGGRGNALGDGFRWFWLQFHA